MFAPPAPDDLDWHDSLASSAFAADTQERTTIPVHILTPAALNDWTESLSGPARAQLGQKRFAAGPGEITALYDETGQMAHLAVGAGADLSCYDLSPAATFLRDNFTADFLRAHIFALKDMEEQAGSAGAGRATRACIGWGLAGLSFAHYHTQSDSGKTRTQPVLLWPEGADRARAAACISAISLLRDLVNLPANHLGPQELENVAQALADKGKATLKTIRGEALLAENYPLIHAVGASSHRAPRLLEISWGEKNHPKVAIVGKGVVFDTGGLNIKTGNWMALMKKDMGGSAHALALAKLVMEMKLPVRLHVLIPAVENAISDTAMRPGDIVPSRKGLSVEVINTDAEGRLVVADALTAACEEDTPDLIIDFTTLTGAARAALGYDVPALFSNNDALAEELKQISMEEHDPLWPLPLWRPYFKDIKSKVADIANDGTGMAGAIYGALFLEAFLSNDPAPDWIHLDMYSWAQSGKAGRPEGGADTGLRAVFRLLEKRYG